MDFEKTGIEGVWIVNSPIYQDERGCFRECFKLTESEKITGRTFSVAQTNSSTSRLGVVRGMHFSTKQEGQWKWITCVSGSILDVVVDIRLNSPTFLKTFQIELSESNQLGILILGNLAHGFQALNSNSIVTYNLSSEYNPELEYEINPLDEDFAINWPIEQKIISKKDQEAPSLRNLQSTGKLPK